MTKKERYEKVLAWFKQNMGEVETELHYGSPFQLLVAVMLSAQCTIVVSDLLHSAES